MRRERRGEAWRSDTPEEERKEGRDRGQGEGKGTA